MARNVRLVFGPPGTGKTQHLLRTMEQQLADGVPPERIAFLSFSRRAVREAVDRAMKQFGGTRTEFPWFRTIHSVAFKLLGLTRDDVLQPRHLAEFARSIGIPLRQRGADDLFHWEGTAGDKALALYHLAAARGTTPQHEWNRVMFPGLMWEGVQYVCEAYERYKRRMALWDFSDMITAASGSLPVDVLLLDESQDTSTAQWRLLRQSAATVTDVYIAGDDDQSIFAWSGADPSILWRLKGERVVLPQSYRLPRVVKALADRVVQRIATRVDKPYAPTDHDGAVHYLGDYEQLRLHEGTWLLLARSNYQLIALRELARRQGVVYTMADGTWSSESTAVRAAVAYEQLRKGKTVTPSAAGCVAKYVFPRPAVTGKELVHWDQILPNHSREWSWMQGLNNLPTHERQYIRALRQTGEPLHGPGRVRISTVHGMKGAEADHVVLLTDLTPTVAAQARADPDAEMRVQYVGITRSANSLWVIRPTRPDYWQF